MGIRPPYYHTGWAELTGNWDVTVDWWKTIMTGCSCSGAGQDGPQKVGTGGSADAATDIRSLGVSDTLRGMGHGGTIPVTYSRIFSSLPDYRYEDDNEKSCTHEKMYS